MLICPFDRVAVVITSGEGTIVKPSVTDFVSAGTVESVTVKVTGVAFAEDEGVPLIPPVAAFTSSPSGRLPDVTVHV
jgi:hypothetical protein